MQRRMKCHGKNGWKRYPGACKQNSQLHKSNNVFSYQMPSQESASDWNFERILGCPFRLTIIEEESVLKKATTVYKKHLFSQILSEIKRPIIP